MCWMGVCMVSKGLPACEGITCFSGCRERPSPYGKLLANVRRRKSPIKLYAPWSSNVRYWSPNCDCNRGHYGTEARTP